MDVFFTFKAAGYMRSCGHVILQTILPGFELRTQESNQSASFEKLLAATGVVWMQRPTREATCFKNNNGGRRDRRCSSMSYNRAGESFL